MSGVGKPGYKETAVGWIPEEWALGKLGDFVASLQAGVSVNAHETETGCLDGQVGVLKTSAVLGGKFFAHQHKVVVPEDVDRVTSPVLADRVVISRMNTPALVGESGYVTTAQPHLFLPDRLWQTVPSDRPHSQRWLSYWLQLPAVKSLIAAGATGTSNSMKNISKDVLLTLPTPHTPLPDQQKIAAILTAVDDKLDLIARQISATQTLKQGLMQTLFTRGAGTPDAQSRWHPHTEFQDTELGRIPVGWRVIAIDEALEVVERPFVMEPQNHYRRVTVKRRHGGVELRDELPGEEIKVKSQFLLEAGDFLISERQIVHGACGIVPAALAGALVSNEYLVLKARANFDVRYFNYLVQLLRYAKLFLVCSQGVDVEKFLFKPKDWLKKSIPVPPLAEQQKIIDTLNALEAKEATLTTQQTHYQSLKRGLMQKLLTGQWRVRVNAAAQATAHEEAPA